MKTLSFSLRNISQWFVAIGLLCLAGYAQGVTFSISPAIVTNDFVGKVVITVDGLTPGATIRIEKYSDLDTNGIINAPENTYLWRSFTVTDGQMPLLAGCTNLNVAGDMDNATNGQIRAELFYPGLDTTVDAFSVKYLYRISDPLGVFQPVTNSFEVRQKPYPQGVSGKVIAAGTGFPLTNAVVVLAPVNTPGAFGAVADSGGNFTVYSPPGNYSFISVYPNTLASGLLIVNSNLFTVQNFTSTPAPFRITGKVSDSSSGGGLGGIGMAAQGANGFCFGLTDSNANYSLPVTSGQWRIGPNQSEVGQLGYLSPDDRVSTNVTGNVSGLNFQLPKATAMIYGRITDSGGTPLMGISIHAQGDANHLETVGRSYPSNGDFALAVTSGSWWVGPDSDSLTPLGLSKTDDLLVSVTNGQSLRVDLVAYRVQVTSFLACGTEGSFCSAQLTAAYGDTPYTWSLAPNSGPMPPGLTLSTNGVVSGIAPVAGSYNVVVRVADQNGLSVDQLVTLAIVTRDSGVPPLHWDDRFSPNGLDGPAYAIATSGSNVFIGGAFASAGGMLASNIAVWNGRSWSPTLGNGVDGQVNAIVVIGSDVYAGGLFLNAGGVSSPMAHPGHLWAQG